MDNKELIPQVHIGELASSLDISVQRVRMLLDRIDQRNRRNLEDAVAIGQELHRVKQQLPHGEFGPWLQSNFAMSRTEATRFLQVADYFADKLSTMDNLPSLTVAYLMAQVSTPESVRQAVLTGEIPQSVKAIKAAIEADKQPNESSEMSNALDIPEQVTEAERIRRLNILAKSAIETGQDIAEVATVLDRAQLLGWAKTMFLMDEQDVDDLIAVATQYKDVELENLSDDTLVDIAGPYAAWHLERYTYPEKQATRSLMNYYQDLMKRVLDMPEFHEKTKIVPAMQPEEYARLVYSIYHYGQSLPIKTFKGKIIDGRMRYLACRDAGRLPRFEEWDGDESGILSYICSVNLFRTHLNESQQVISQMMLEEWQAKQ